MPFETDLNFENNFKRCKECTNFVKDIPINDLLGSNTLNDISMAIKAILNYFSNKISVFQHYS